MNGGEERKKKNIMSGMKSESDKAEKNMILVLFLPFYCDSIFLRIFQVLYFYGLAD